MELCVVALSSVLLFSAAATTVLLLRMHGGEGGGGPGGGGSNNLDGVLPGPPSSGGSSLSAKVLLKAHSLRDWYCDRVAALANASGAGGATALQKFLAAHHTQLRPGDLRAPAHHPDTIARDNAAAAAAVAAVAAAAGDAGACDCAADRVE